MNHSNHSTEFGMGLVFTAKGQTEGPYSSEVILMISLAAGICSLVTVVGNTVVIISFFINKSLRNFSNYMILSLALSDLTIGAFSMNVFTTYNVNKKWILGPAMCKAWLSVDYTASNASVMNLLVICVDRLVISVFLVRALLNINFPQSNFQVNFLLLNAIKTFNQLAQIAGVAVRALSLKTGNWV